MDSSLRASGVTPGLEYLAALLALREGLLEPADLTAAVTALVDGNATSLASAFEQVGAAVTRQQMQECVEQARVCTDLIAAKNRLAEIKRRGRQVSSAEPLIDFDTDSQPMGLIEGPHPAAPSVSERMRGRPAAHAEVDLEPSGMPADGTAGGMESAIAGRRGPVHWVDDDELDPEARFVAKIPEEDFEWRPTSDLLSHFYLIEDTIRSFTGGLLGITSAVGLLICLGLATWGVIRSGILEEYFTTPETPAVASVEPPAAAPKIPPREITLPIAAPELPFAAEMTESSPEASEQSMGQVVQSEVEIPTPAVEVLPDSWRTDALIEIEEQMRLVNQDLGRLDYELALSRLEQLQAKRRGTLDPTLDSRWLIIGASLLTHQGDEESLTAAVEWLGPLFDSENSQARLVLARWLFAATPAQLEALHDLVMTRGGEPAADMINWLFASRSNSAESLEGLSDTVDAIKARLQEPSPDPLNYLFLSVASFNQGNRKDAYNALRDFSPYLKQASYWSDNDINPEARWIREVAERALNSAGVALKKKLDLASR